MDLGKGTQMVWTVLGIILLVLLAVWVFRIVKKEIPT